MNKYLRFRTVVTRNEFRALRGPRYRTILYLSSILYLTFLCIGFSGNALLFLDRLARNPLSNWVNIGISKNTRDSTESLAGRLTDTAVRQRFLIGNFYLTKEFGASFLDREGNCTGLPMPRVRTTNPNSAVIRDILAPDNVVKINAGNAFRAEPLGFVVTRQFLARLGFHPDSGTWLSYRLYGARYVPVAILSVVKELPGQADILCTDLFYLTQMHDYPVDSLYSRIWIETRDPARIRMITEAIRKKAGIPAETPVPDSARGYNHSLTVLHFPNKLPQTALVFSDNLRLLYGMNELKDVRFGTYSGAVPEPADGPGNAATGLKRDFNFDYLAIEFTRPDRVREFAGYIRDRYGLTVNMETVTRQQNYLFSLNISLGAIILVLVLSAMSIVIFLSSTLKNHLDRVKRNLGNFLAFGTTGLQITSIYLEVVFLILLASVLPALGLAWVSGELFDHYLLQRLLILDEGREYFSLFNPWLAFFILMVFASALMKTAISVTLLVRHSPGDLINERAGKGY